MAGRSRWLALVGLLTLAGACLAQEPRTPPRTAPGERYVLPRSSAEDARAGEFGDVWTLDFKFRDPQLIRVNIPGRGQQTVWYLWYQVINRDRVAKPLTFFPEFELVTRDTKMTYRDMILPEVQAIIEARENPTGFKGYKIFNSVTIAREPVPYSPEKAAPRPLTGVAIWMDPNEIYPGDDEATRARKKRTPKLADSNLYDIFIAGLSNGWAETDPLVEGGPTVIRRKTLQLTFRRLGDRHLMRSEEIKFEGPPRWYYRASKLKLPGAKESEAPKGP